MPRVQLPPGCAGFTDGNRSSWPSAAPAPSSTSTTPTPPARGRSRSCKDQDYASAGLVDAGPEKFFVKQRPRGPLVPALPVQHDLPLLDEDLPACGGETIPESEMSRDRPAGQYMP